ncbi:MAG: putative N-acetyltransferase, partial [Actinomycetia bacterium]|nr:putative N-acetyltransferase [Actinomycetes bacterium]
MTVDIRACASVEELRDALNAIGHYFGHESQLEDAERFANRIEIERMHAAFESDGIIGGAGAFTYRMSVPGGRAIPT